MKKIFILALLLLTLCCHASAASSIQIDNVTSKEVNNYIVNFITASGQNYILDSATEYGLVFTATHVDRKSTRLNSSHANESRMPSSA